ncbi:hypothetical protein BY996DRAFT_7529707 [Phakopsora pachyrhizi]|nr:hypothetical protein BY996DRAFT_7529707 [Phakopsora pachyrhizi]
MIKKNEENFFFIKNSQLQDFFLKPASLFFQLQKIDPIKKNIEYPIQKYYAAEIIKVFDQLDWRGVLIADNNVEESEKIKLTLKNNTIPAWAGQYKMYIRTILIIRNLFIAYSTLINKIFCEGAIDLQESFLKRQKEAINFFDSIWSLFKPKNSGVFIIEDEYLPINESEKTDFLNSFICMHTDKHFQIKINNFNKNRSETLWKIIYLWLLHSRNDWYKQLLPQLKSPSFGFKCFIQSLFLSIIKCYY